MEEKRREQKEEAARRVKPKRSPFVVPVLVALCLAVWIAPSLMPPREPPLSVDTLERSARLTLYLASLRIREFHASHKRYPVNLTEAGIDTMGIVYVRNAETAFELSTRVQGSRMVYRSTQPDSLFLGANLRLRGIS